MPTPLGRSKKIRREWNLMGHTSLWPMGGKIIKENTETCKTLVRRMI
jgi:hypothetical protein